MLNLIEQHELGPVANMGLLESAVAMPQMSVFGEDAYRTVVHKAAALMFSLARNHALVDGNKRIAWHAARLFAILNGYDFDRHWGPWAVLAQEKLVLSIVSHEVESIEDLTMKLVVHLTRIGSGL